MIHRYRTRLLRPPTCNRALVGDLCSVEVEVTATEQNPVRLDGQPEPPETTKWTRIVQVRVTAASVRQMAEQAARNKSGKSIDGDMVAKVMSGKGKV